MRVKFSVRLPAADVEFLDEYAKRVGSRSAALHEAVRLLRVHELADSYAEAWDEWVASGEEEIWSVTISDGLAEETWPGPRGAPTRREPR